MRVRFGRQLVQAMSTLFPSSPPATPTSTSVSTSSSASSIGSGSAAPSASTSATRPLLNVTRYEKLLREGQPRTGAARTRDDSQIVHEAILGLPLDYHLETGSTMDIASAKVSNSSAVSGELILAECQTKARGRKGRSWKQSE